MRREVDGAAQLAAKMIGRWRSGATLTLTLAPEHDDPGMVAGVNRVPERQR